tara:strand:- start:462 stop:1295 length:834 start_codon:yes stop_codon:yes gene_type:complete
MIMNKKQLAMAATVMTLCVAGTSHAHRAWILPASTVHSSETPWVTFDAAISNDIFHTDYRPMSLENVQAIGPDGSFIPLQNAHTGKYRSTFDLELDQQGTYRVFTASHGLSARWETADGERRMYPGRGRAYTPEGFAAEVPEDAHNLQVTWTSRRQETFVTAGIPDDTALEVSGEGFEMEALTHPNDLYAGETAEFRFLINGQPAVGAELTVLAGGMRYRDSQDEILATTDADGIVSITWPDAGMYWLEANYQDDQGEAPATHRSGSYVATFEVLPL